MMKSTLMSWGLIFTSALFDSFAAFAAKSRFNVLGRMELSPPGRFLDYLRIFFQSPLVVVAAVLFVAAPVLWFFALSRLDLSVAYPAVVVFHLIFISLFSVFLLGEAWTAGRIVGICFAFCSLFFLYR